MVRVKICGITNLADARHAADSGADALGFVFAPSPRRVRTTEAKRIIKKLGPWIATVGVFVNETPESVKKITAECGLTAVQLHGDESAAYANRLKHLTRIKAFRVGEDFRWDADVRAYPAEAYLFDTKVSGKFGGSGKTFRWKTLKGLRIDRPVILSGGLNPTNVRQAVEMLSPYGVDASSSLESSPGKKDPKLVKEFIRNAKKN